VTKAEILDLLDQVHAEVKALDDPPLRAPGDRVPMQPIVVGPDGVTRFRRNALVDYLLANGGIDMNRLAVLPNISREDRAQFAQLIGYSVGGYCDLSYALGVEEACAEAERVRKAATS
jgi:hypothetical protein